MRFQSPVAIHVQVKTPVFVGDGNMVSPLSFVCDDDLVHVLDDNRFFHALAPKEQQSYLAWIEPILDHLSRLDAQLAQAGRDSERRQQLKRERRQVAAGLAVEQFLRQQLGKDAAAFVRGAGCVAYSMRWAVRPREDGFRSFIKEAGYRPYVPGTSIKGALRTALLYALLGEGKDYAVLLAQLREMLRGDSSPTEKVRQLSRIASQVEGAALREVRNDAKYDRLKLIQVGDGALLAPGVLRVRALESVGTGRFTRTLAEALEPGTAFAFRLALVAGEEVAWALQRLGLEVPAGGPSVERLFAACHERSAAILRADESYFQDNPAMLREVRRLQAENQPRTPLLRLGAGQGFLSVTVDLRVRNRDPELYDEAIREGVSFQRRWHTQRGNFPKTRRVVSDGHGRTLTLPGWVRLESHGTV